MDKIKFQENLIDQIKEAQLKLGFAKETIRLYYPAASLCRLLNLECKSGEELVEELENGNEFKETPLGEIKFSLCGGERIEVQIPAEGAVYVNENIPDPPFLVRIIDLFGHRHHSSEEELTIEDICECFKSFNDNYVCEKMETETDFDYVLYFPDEQPDAWYYCIKFEMNHVIYHRFTKEDYFSIVKCEI